MPSNPIPGSTGEVLTCLPSPYLPHPANGLFICRGLSRSASYVKRHGPLPASYAKNYKRGLDRFLCMHLGVDPDAVEKIVQESADAAEIDRRLAELFPRRPPRGGMES